MLKLRATVVVVGGALAAALVAAAPSPAAESSATSRAVPAVRRTTSPKVLLAAFGQRACPPRAAAVSYSDALDKLVVGDATVGGLSDLAYDRRARSYVSTVDNHGTDPARLYRIGSPLAPDITRRPLPGQLRDRAVGARLRAQRRAGSDAGRTGAVRRHPGRRGYGERNPRRAEHHPLRSLPDRGDGGHAIGRPAGRRRRGSLPPLPRLRGLGRVLRAAQTATASCSSRRRPSTRRPATRSSSSQ